MNKYWFAQYADYPYGIDYKTNMIKNTYASLVQRPHKKTLATITTSINQLKRT